MQEYSIVDFDPSVTKVAFVKSFGNLRSIVIVKVASIAHIVLWSRLLCIPLWFLTIYNSLLFIPLI